MTSTKRQRDERHARIAIHLQRAAVDLKAAEHEIYLLAEPHDTETPKDAKRLNRISLLLKLIHNRYSHIKMP